MTVQIERLSDGSTTIVNGVKRVTDKGFYVVVEDAYGTRVLVRSSYAVTEIQPGGAVGYSV